MTDYEMLCEQVKSLISGVKYSVTNMANISALIYDSLDDINWAGFYLLMDEKLILGPFQGKTACTQIDYAKGVCGSSWKNDDIIIVPNVHEFPGHIACDSNSKSEIVLPIHCKGNFYGVLDIDSPNYERFSNIDKEGLIKLVKIFEKSLED